MSALDWETIVHRFSRSSGVDTRTLKDADLVPLVQLWARANTEARMERQLVSLLPDAPERYEPHSLHVAVALMFGILIVLLIVCMGVWRFFA